MITGRMNAKPDGGDLFALIPAGTGNSMANDLRLTTTEQAIHSLVHGARLISQKSSSPTACPERWTAPQPATATTS